MKKLYNIIIAIAFLLSAYSTYAQEENVLLNKIYPLTDKTGLSLNNQFGDITITTWNKNEFSVSVKMDFTGLSEKEVKNIREKVSVEDSSTPEMVEVKTLIKSGSIKLNGKGKKFAINYEVKVPDNHPLDIKNSFGNFTVLNYNGPIKLDLEYGNLSMGNIKDLELELAFGNGTIYSLTSGHADIEYADNFTITELETLQLDSDFSKINIGKAGNINLDAKYGHLKIGSVNVLKGKSEFSGLKIEELGKTLILKGSYVSGSLEVEKIKKDFEKIKLDAEYSEVKLTFEQGKSIEFQVFTDFGDFKYPEKLVSFSRKIQDDFSKEFKGTIGEGQKAEGTVTIKTSYGNARIAIE